MTELISTRTTSYVLTTMWAFLKRYDKSKNGRSAIMVLKLQNEGCADKQLLKVNAHAAIARARLGGASRTGPTFLGYVATHTEAHTTLADCGEIISESKKITDFMTGINDPSMAPANAGDATKMVYFDVMQTYLQNFVSVGTAHKAMQRSIADVGASTDADGWMSKEDWWALEASERKAHTEKKRACNNK
jgi:hypothetical protein